MKTLNLMVSMAAALTLVTLLGASSWSPVITRYRFVVFGGKLLPA
jgi:hypothetical protein